MGPTRRPLKVESKLKGTELIWEMSTCTLTNLTDILIYLRFCSLSAETARLLGRGAVTKIYRSLQWGQSISRSLFVDDCTRNNNFNSIK